MTGVEVVGPAGQSRIAAERVILAGGAYGSPLILLRSGIGAADELRALGISPYHDLPGVGRNLQDHPAIGAHYQGRPETIAALEAFVAAGGLPREEGTIGLARSSRCEGPYDLHLYPIASRPFAGKGWRFHISAAVMAPRSRGTIGLNPADRPTPRRRRSSTRTTSPTPRSTISTRSPTPSPSAATSARSRRWRRCWTAS